jgi:curved DNA-binding protein CbpA
MNPYEVLQVQPQAGPKEIIQASALALRQRRYTAREIAEARQQLMDPDKRFILDFIYSVDLSPLLQLPPSPLQQYRIEDLHPLTLCDVKKGQ